MAPARRVRAQVADTLYHATLFCAVRPRRGKRIRLALRKVPPVEFAKSGGLARSAQGRDTFPAATWARPSCVPFACVCQRRRPAAGRHAGGGAHNARR